MSRSQPKSTWVGASLKITSAAELGKTSIVTAQAEGTIPPADQAYGSMHTHRTPLISQCGG